MACGCNATEQCSEETLASVSVAQHPQTQGVDLSYCADCGGTTDFVPMFVAAIVIVALLRSFRRRTPFLTLELSAGGGYVVRGNPPVANLHHPAGAFGQRGIVRDDHQRPPGLPEVGEERHDVAA